MSAPIDPQHGNSGPGGPVFPGPEIPQTPAESEQPETRHGAADIQHPGWCDPKFCTVTADRNRWHASRPVTVRGDSDDLTIVVQLYAWPDGRNAYANIAPTLVDMEGGTTTEEWPVPVELALELGHVLVSLARQATP